MGRRRSYASFEVNKMKICTDGQKDTIITSTTKKSEGVERSFFQRVLSALRAQERNAQLSIEYLMEMILITATESFNRKDIKIFDLEKSPLDVYRESILNAVSTIYTLLGNGKTDI